MKPNYKKNDIVYRVTSQCKVRVYQVLSAERLAKRKMLGNVREFQGALNLKTTLAPFHVLRMSTSDPDLFKTETEALEEAVKRLTNRGAFLANELVLVTQRQRLLEGHLWEAQNRLRKLKDTQDHG